MYQIIATKFLVKQVKELDDKTKKIIREKKELIKLNPSRYKKVETKSYRHVFSIKLSSESKAKRLIYAVIKDKVFLCFLLDRSKGYKDLKRYFKKIKSELI